MGILKISSKIFQRGGGGAAGNKYGWREGFQMFTTLLLSLLLPLSFLLLSRLSAARYLTISLHPQPFFSSSSFSSSIPNFLWFLSVCSFSAILYTLVSLLSVAAFVHCLTAGGGCGGVKSLNLIMISSPSTGPEPISHPRLCVAWVILCTFQVCVGLGLEGSISSGIDGSGFGISRAPEISSSSSSLFFIIMSRLLLFVGLHETMLFWSKAVVKPVVEDTVMGLPTTTTSIAAAVVKEEDDEITVFKRPPWRAVERVGMALSLGTLWWWSLRDEVDSLVVVAELLLKAHAQFGVADFLGWCLYYLTVSIGIIRALKGVIWLLGTILPYLSFRRSKAGKDPSDSFSHPPKVDQDKV